MVVTTKQEIVYVHKSPNESPGLKHSANCMTDQDTVSKGLLFAVFFLLKVILQI